MSFGFVTYFRKRFKNLVPRSILTNKTALEPIYIYIYIYPVTNKLSDAKVKRHGYKLALFGVGGGTFVVGPFFKNTSLHSDLRVTKLSDASIN